MYARYVPSAAGTAPAEPASRSPAPVDAEPAGAATMAAPTSYARYVPGAGNGSNNTPDASDDIDDRPAKKARLSPQPAKHTKTKSKKRTSKRRTSAVDSDAEESSTSSDDESDRKNDRVSQEPVVEAEEDEEQSSPTPVEIQAAPKKPKREKKSKKSMTTEAQSDDDADDKVEKRHRAVFERKRKSMQAPTLADATPKDGEDATMEDAPSPEEAHGLEPLPQPKPTELDDTIPTFETLPLWLAEPIRVSPQAVADFDKLGSSPELGISSDVTAKLASVGYKNAFAIQTAVIPLLLPHHCNSRQGDILVSAATGSGKTLSYALPMIRDLSYGNRRLTRLRALVVLPTRELVKQAQQVCEEIAGVFAIDGARRRVRVGVSMGSQNLEKEQSAFVEREETYDPEAYAARTRRLAAGEYDQDADATDDEERADRSRQEDRIPTLPDHVIQYKSKIDVLICTPGRLVEHIKYTPGFSLDYVRWLVVDEADKLLGQDFQQWLDVVIPPLHQDPNSQKRNHHHSNLSGVRKVILSATMTRDLERLGGLKLRRPSLVVLEGAAGTENDVDMSRAEHALPELLEEAALKVSDPNVKPVFLVDLLRSKKILGNAAGEAPALPRGEDDDTSSSESEADTSSEEEEEDDESSSSDSEVESDKSSSPQPKHNQSSSSPSVLIFTKSNETAMRLSRLLSLISPKLAPLLGTLTSTTAYSSRRQTLRDFTSGKLRVLVASDLVARGIDLPSLDHVINYDMPTSIASYVHRVGRTARAGKSGKAWTLFTKPEARWFWTEIAGARVITRVKEVQRVRVTEEKEALFDEKVKVYETALETLGQEAGEMRRRGRA